ncbi:MAG: hypothetical protein IPO65_12585 [Saprospiraceae bacterium]|nr:hypothetical protein [Saprospiraceae bacterium]
MKSLLLGCLTFLVSVCAFSQSDSSSFKKEKLAWGLYMRLISCRSFKIMGAYIMLPIAKLLDIRLNYTRSIVRGIGLEPLQRYTSGGELTGALVEPVYPLRNTQGWFPSYKTTISTFEIQGQIQLLRIVNNNLPVDDKHDLYFFGGFGLSYFRAKLDLLDTDNEPYENVIAKTNWSFDKFNTTEGREQIRTAIKSLYDQNYESDSPNDSKGIPINIIYGGGLSVIVAKNVKLGFEYKTMYFKGMEYVDGLKFRDSGFLMSNKVSAQYFQIGLEYFLR